jgi:predicted dehydrogenase
MSPIQIGIIGAGGIVRDRHLPGLAAIPDVAVTVVCNRTRATAERVAAEHNIPRVVSDWHEVVAMPEVDAVLIGATPYLHCAATCAALAAGKHVLCQARMAMNVAEARLMLEAARAARGRVAMLVPGPMALAAEPYIKHLLAEGYLGRPYLVRVQALGSAYADPAAPLHWRQTREISGVNTLTVGIYAEIVQRLLGDTVSLIASGTVSVPERVDPSSGMRRAVEYPDSLTIVAHMASGAQAVYAFSEVVRHPPSQRIEIYGSDGSLAWDVNEGQLYGARANEPGWQPLPIPEDMRGGWQVEAIFVAAIREGKPAWPTFEDGLKYMTFTEAAIQSGVSGRAVTLAAL